MNQKGLLPILLLIGLLTSLSQIGCTTSKDKITRTSPTPQTDPLYEIEKPYQEINATLDNPAIKEDYDGPNANEPLEPPPPPITE